MMPPEPTLIVVCGHKTRTQAFYEEMPTERLRALQAWFRQALADGDDAAYCAHRIDLIARVLAARAAEPPHG